MIEIQMSKDIREFAPKLIGPLTARQVLCILIALVYVIPLMIFLPFSTFTNLIICTVLAVPTVACGWATPFGMPLEKFIIQAFRILVFSSHKRKYRSVNEYEAMYDSLTEKKPALKKTKKSKKIASYK